MPFCWSSDVCSRSEEHTSELQSHDNLVCRLLLENKQRSTESPCWETIQCFPCTAAAAVQCNLRRGFLGWLLHKLCCFFFLMMRRPPKSTLFPHPTFFR